MSRYTSVFLSLVFVCALGLITSRAFELSDDELFLEILKDNDTDPKEDKKEPKFSFNSYATVDDPDNAEEWDEFNSSVLLLVKRIEDGIENHYSCSGVLIKPNVVATNAHCGVDAVEIRVSNNHRLDWDTEKDWRTATKSNIYVHPEYNIEKSDYENDIALLVLDRDFDHNINYAPLLPKNETLEHGQLVERVGYGGRQSFKTGFLGIGPKNKKTLVGAYFKEELTETKKGASNFVTYDKLSVQGDSGGPIFVRLGPAPEADQKDTRKLYLYGIHSCWTKKTKQTVAVKLSHYENWLEEISQKPYINEPEIKPEPKPEPKPEATPSPSPSPLEEYPAEE